MDPFLVIMTVILLIGGIILTTTIIITTKKGLSVRWYGFLIIIFTSIALGIHFGINLMNDLVGGLIIAIVFTVVGGIHWFGILKIREKIHGKRD